MRIRHNNTFVDTLFKSDLRHSSNLLLDQFQKKAICVIHMVSPSIVSLVWFVTRPTRFIASIQFAVDVREQSSPSHGLKYFSSRITRKQNINWSRKCNVYFSVSREIYGFKICGFKSSACWKFLLKCPSVLSFFVYLGFQTHFWNAGIRYVFSFGIFLH